MELKDGIIGALLIGMVALAGWIGFVYVNPPTKTKIEEDTDYVYLTPPQEPTDTGLPDDWSTAPNASYFVVNNGTTTFNVSLGEILEYVAIGNVYDAKVEWRKRICERRGDVITITDSVSGYSITGVDILKILNLWDTNFAGALECNSKNDDTVKWSVDVKEMTTKMYADPKDSIILAVAANGQWLQDSPIGDYSGNFSIFGENMDVPLYNLQNITVTNNWTIDVYVNDVLELSLDPYNLTSNPTSHDYYYADFDWWNYNRTYWGVNISNIVNYTSAKETNYTLRFDIIDQIAPELSEPAYNWTDVEDHLYHNGTHMTGLYYDYVNGTGQDNETDGSRLPATNLRICLMFKEDRGLEYRESKGWYNNDWPYALNHGYPCYSIIVPGRIKRYYLNGVMAIRITIHSYTR